MPTQPERAQPLVIHRDGDQVLVEEFPELVQLPVSLLGATQFVTTFTQIRMSNADCEYMVVGTTPDGLTLVGRKFNRLGYPR